jgi:hypothetical protein
MNGTTTLATNTSPTYNVFNSGSYWVHGEDHYGCYVDTKPVTVTIIQSPPAVISGVADQCIGSSYTLNGWAGNDPTLTYKWFKNGVAVGSGDSYTDPGSTTAGQFTYKLVVCATVSGVQCCSTSQPFVVTVHPLPQVSITTASMLDCNSYTLLLGANGTPAGGSYLWSNGMSGQHITAQGGGPYRVWYTDQSGCVNHGDTDLPKDPKEYLWIFPTGCFNLCANTLTTNYIVGPLIPWVYWAYLNDPVGPVIQSGSGTVPPFYLPGPGSYDLVLQNIWCSDTARVLDVTTHNCDTPLPCGCLHADVSSFSQPCSSGGGGGSLFVTVPADTGCCYFIRLCFQDSCGAPVNATVTITNGTLTPSVINIPAGSSCDTLKFTPSITPYTGGVETVTITWTDQQGHLHQCSYRVNITPCNPPPPCGCPSIEDISSYNLPCNNGDSSCCNYFVRFCAVNGCTYPITVTLTVTDGTLSPATVTLPPGYSCDTVQFFPSSTFTGGSETFTMTWTDQQGVPHTCNYGVNITPCTINPPPPPPLCDCPKLNSIVSYSVPCPSGDPKCCAYYVQLCLQNDCNYTINATASITNGILAPATVTLPAGASCNTLQFQPYIMPYGGGTETVTLTWTDAQGNNHECSYKVDVKPCAPPPDCGCPELQDISSYTLSCPNGDPGCCEYYVRLCMVNNCTYPINATVNITNGTFAPSTITLPVGVSCDTLQFLPYILPYSGGTETITLMWTDPQGVQHRCIYRMDIPPCKPPVGCDGCLQEKSISTYSLPCPLNPNDCCNYFVQLCLSNNCGVPIQGMLSITDGTIAPSTITIQPGDTCVNLQFQPNIPFAGGTETVTFVWMDPDGVSHLCTYKVDFKRCPPVSYDCSCLKVDKISPYTEPCPNDKSCCDYFLQICMTNTCDYRIDATLSITDGTMMPATISIPPGGSGCPTFQFLPAASFVGGSETLFIEWIDPQGIAHICKYNVDIPYCDVAGRPAGGDGSGAATSGMSIMSNLTLVPNPAQHTTRIDYQVYGSGEGTIQVFDMLGRLTDSYVFTKAAGSWQLPLDNYLSGVYMVALKQKNGITLRYAKLVIIK